MLSLSPSSISVSVSLSSCASMSESAVVLVAEMMLSFEGVVGCRAGGAAALLSLVSTGAGCLCWSSDDGAELSAKVIFRFFSGVEDKERSASAIFEIRKKGLVSVFFISLEVESMSLTLCSSSILVLR